MEGKIKYSNIPIINDSPAYWINSYGKILSVYKTHIDAVCDCPEAFGLSIEYIASLYKKYKEPLRFEGKARHIIIEELIKNDSWIRIRYNPMEDVYHIELDRLCNWNKNVLWAWAVSLIKANKKQTFSGVLICELSSDYNTTTGTIMDISKDKLFTHSDNNLDILTPINSVSDFTVVNIEAVLKAHCRHVSATAEYVQNLANSVNLEQENFLKKSYKDLYSGNKVIQ